ncbi:antibiotic biosynthesis monooxygenase [Catellatospora tritici]|uniref:antibiotic biosynthesis monooxygenase n=1 Tax=Catellatospora tritici TaxID=2851566 RepID=UPI001C2CE50A|nr:antibiotic biosynthesis monooxygenase [Catellatospora tritici]MBV1851282.1 antibiotic biosynthesis monooxygenase [Catellatospora tritici]
MAPSVELEPVSVLFTFDVVPGRESDFEHWLRLVNAESSKFPGHQGVTWLRPTTPDRHYHAVLRFDNGTHLSAWLTSTQRVDCVRHLDGIAEEAAPRETTTGMETWFSLPGRPVLPPPKWKMALVSFLGVYPLVVLFQLVGAKHVAAMPLPLFLRAAVLPLMLSPLLTYAVMPLLSRLLRRFLYSGS